jgi:hypothetical protein
MTHRRRLVIVRLGAILRRVGGKLVHGEGGTLRRLRNKHAAPQRQNGAGNAQRTSERYLGLAREANLNGDIVEAENCYQRAEHDFRVM